MPSRSRTGSPPEVVIPIHIVRKQRVILDADLAALYGVQTRRLNEQIRRNVHRFPVDFAFLLTIDEMSVLMSQNATSKRGRGVRRKVARAFTEHGALMAATVLNSDRAVEVSLFVVRAFVRLRDALAQHHELSAKLAEVETRLEALALKHHAPASQTHRQLKEVFDAIRTILKPSDTVEKRPIGFVTEQKHGA